MSSKYFQYERPQIEPSASFKTVIGVRKILADHKDGKLDMAGVYRETVFLLDSYFSSK